MHDAVEELERALNAGDLMMAKRYLSKIKATIFCVKCGKRIDLQVVDADTYYKGYIHSSCREEVPD